MDKADFRRKFVVLDGGRGIEGPITRLGLRHRFPGIPNRELVLLLVSKFILLGGLAYWLYG